jgi:hypothetical protein
MFVLFSMLWKQKYATFVEMENRIVTTHPRMASWIIAVQMKAGYNVIHV